MFDACITAIKQLGCNCMHFVGGQKADIKGKRCPTGWPCSLTNFFYDMEREWRWPHWIRGLVYRSRANVLYTIQHTCWFTLKASLHFWETFTSHWLLCDCIERKRDDAWLLISIYIYTLQWRHNGCDSVSNHQPHDCLLNRLFRRRSQKTSKLRVTGLCAGNSPIPRTNGQLRGKCFHLMTSSWKT